jgi:motility quorum-sensing regulator / GCU-specific mRNA interferase toxin
MEKRTPHSSLSLVKSLVNAGRIRTTQSARQGAAAMGIDFEGMCHILRELTLKDFYKSMTTYDDHTVWQDVYRPHTLQGEVYLKLTVVDDLLIVSFKEL